MKGTDLKEWREKHNLTQQDLASVLRVSVPSIRRWESDKGEPIPRHLYRIQELMSGKTGVLSGTTGLTRDDVYRLIAALISKDLTLAVKPNNPDTAHALFKGSFHSVYEFLIDTPIHETKH